MKVDGRDVSGKNNEHTMDGIREAAAAATSSCPALQSGPSYKLLARKRNSYDEIVRQTKGRKQQRTKSVSACMHGMHA
jgi:hypothetical protein